MTAGSDAAGGSSRGGSSEGGPSGGGSSGRRVAPREAYDAVVVGAGHNGLVTASYLARAGLRTLVLERRDRVGGALDTIEIAPHVRVPAVATTVGRLRPSVARDLDLRRFGLSLVQPAARVFAPQPDGRAVTFWGDAARTADELRAWSTRDAANWAPFDRLVRSLGRFLGELAATTPPDIKSPSIEDALSGVKLGRTYRGLGREDARSLMRVLPMAIADLAAEWFQSDAVRAALAVRGVRYAALGPWSAGTANVFLSDAAGTDAGTAGEAVVARGGPGRLAEALAAAARSFGSEIRTGAGVVSIMTRDGRATGVALASGEEIAARAVVVGSEPKRAILDLLDPVEVGPRLRWRAGNYRTPGVIARVNLALSGFPSFTAAAGDLRRVRGRIVVAPGIDYLERAFDAAKYGRLSEQPYLDAMIPSLVDPSLVAGAPDGTHVMSINLQYAPYGLRDGGPGAWEARRDELADLAIRTLETYAPGIGALVTARHVLTPLDLERDYGLTEGHPLHGEPSLDQWFAWRPLLGHADYRLALDGVYLCGSGAHPGGGVTGGPGQNAARMIVRDLERRREQRVG